MKTASSYNYAKEKHKNSFFSNKDKLFISFSNPAYFLLFSLCLALFFSFYLIYFPSNTNTNTNKYTSNFHYHKYNQTKAFTAHPKRQNEKCDLFKGKWIRDGREPLYTNHTCKTIPFLKNCFLHGRKDTGFLHWRWKPDLCELPRFNPGSFLETGRGKTMAFIGDSVARNQMESLLCLLSTVEIPQAKHKDPEDRFPTWEFREHNFTLMAFWSQFLVVASERVVNRSATGGFDLHLDRIDITWSEKLPSIDYAIFSDAHWFFRQNYLYEEGRLIGCIYCQAPNVTDLGPGLAIRRAFRAAFRAINDCKNCKKIFALLRTYSPSHFENGTWNTGGGCNRTRPIGNEEVNRDGADWEYRRIQVEEIENARSLGEERGNVFEVLDITEIMSMRADGHPGIHWGNQWMKGYSDCIHWCLPGPIDTWNELMFEMIIREV